MKNFPLSYCRTNTNISFKNPRMVFETEAPKPAPKSTETPEAPEVKLNRLTERYKTDRQNALAKIEAQLTEANKDPKNKELITTLTEKKNRIERMVNPDTGKENDSIQETFNKLDSERKLNIIRGSLTAIFKILNLPGAEVPNWNDLPGAEPKSSPTPAGSPAAQPANAPAKATDVTPKQAGASNDEAETMLTIQTSRWEKAPELIKTELKNAKKIAETALSHLKNDTTTEAAKDREAIIKAYIQVIDEVAKDKGEVNTTEQMLERNKLRRDQQEKSTAEKSHALVENQKSAQAVQDYFAQNENKNKNSPIAYLLKNINEGTIADMPSFNIALQYCFDNIPHNQTWQSLAGGEYPINIKGVEFKIKVPKAGDKTNKITFNESQPGNREDLARILTSTSADKPFAQLLRREEKPMNWSDGVPKGKQKSEESHPEPTAARESASSTPETADQNNKRSAKFVEQYMAGAGKDYLGTLINQGNIKDQESFNKAIDEIFSKATNVKGLRWLETGNGISNQPITINGVKLSIKIPKTAGSELLSLQGNRRELAISLAKYYPDSPLAKSFDKEIDDQNPGVREKFNTIAKETLESLNDLDQKEGFLDKKGGLSQKFKESFTSILLRDMAKDKIDISKIDQPISTEPIWFTHNEENHPFRVQIDHGGIKFV